jgi:hypothetical protein
MWIKLKPFVSVVAGGTASLSTTECDGFAVHAIRLVLGGTTFTKAQVDRFNVRLNKKDIVNSITGTQVNSINTWRKCNIVASNNDLPWYFGNPNALSFKGQHATDLDLSAIKDPQSGNAASLEIQVDIDAGASAPTLVAYAEVLSPKKAFPGSFKPSDYGVVKAFVKTILAPSAGLTLAAFDIGFGSHAGAGIINEFWFHTYLTSLQIKKSGVIIWDNIAIQEMNAWQQDYGHTAVSGMYVWSPTYQGIMGTIEPTMAPGGGLYPFQHLLTCSQSDTISVFAELATSLDKL